MLAAIFGPRPWAQGVASELRDAVTGVQLQTCVTWAELSAALQVGGVSVVVAQLGRDTPTAPLAALAQQAGSPPLVVCAEGDVPAATLLDVVGAGAAGLVRDGERAALTTAVRRALAPDPQPPARPSPGIEGAFDDQGRKSLGLLADRVGQPLALVRDGLVQHVNPALRELFGLAREVDLFGRPLADFAASDAAKPLSALLARAMLLDLDDKTRETISFVPAEGAAFAAEVTASPLTIGTRPGLVVMLNPTGADAEIRSSDATALPSLGDDREALFARLAVLADDASPVERTSVLALAVIADYADQRRREGFAGAAHLVQILAQCLSRAAPPEGVLYAVAEDALAILVEDVSTAEVGRMRHRLAEAQAETAEPLLKQIRLRLGVVRVTPGVGAPLELLDHALRDAAPAGAETPDASETTDGLEMSPPGYTVDIPSAPSHSLPDSVSPTSVLTASSAAPAPAHGTNADATPRPALEQERRRDAGTLVDELTERIDRALAGEGFMLALQPIVSLMGDSREHYSVLARLRQADGSLADAAQIIGLAAGSDRMADIDRWVIRSALGLLNRRRRSGDKAAFFLSLSPELVADEQLLIWICDTLREFDVRGSWLTFQMQEQHALAQPERWNELVAGLREIRCRICINQYGLIDAVSGVATTTADFIKFAPSLATGLSGDKDKQHRILELIRLVKGRGIRTIVTGVDDSRALNLIWDAGIEYVQGNYLQAPTTRVEPVPDGVAPETEAASESARPPLRL
jgi:PAS domain S-box-containing protein